MAAVVDENEGGLNVESTKVDALADLDEVGEAHSSHIRIGSSRVKEGNVSRILIHDAPGPIPNLLPHQPSVIRPKARDVGVVPVDDGLEVKLVLKRARGLQTGVRFAAEGDAEEGLPLLLAVGREAPPVGHVVHGHSGLPRVGIVLVVVAATIPRSRVVEADVRRIGVVRGGVAGCVQRRVVALVVGQVPVGSERLGDVRPVEEEVQVAVPHVLLVIPGSRGEARVPLAPDRRPLGVHGLPHGHLQVGAVHVLLLVVRGLELDAAGHGDVRVGVVIVHARAAVDGVHGREEVVDEGFVCGVGVVVVVGVHDGYNEGHVAGGHLASLFIVPRVVSTAALEVLGEDGEGGKLDGIHRLVDLVDCGSSLVHVQTSDTKKLRVR
mmetsp:Transcript_37633/g.90747  ORF Transcript_37633/g.90747 Transcript_37633/m.90747 type:complete len:380 (-) Transcript_37633:250-1389(-)